MTAQAWNQRLYSTITNNLLPIYYHDWLIQKKTPRKQDVLLSSSLTSTLRTPSLSFQSAATPLLYKDPQFKFTEVHFVPPPFDGSQRTPPLSFGRLCRTVCPSSCPLSPRCPPHLLLTAKQQRWASPDYLIHHVSKPCGSTVFVQSGQDLRWHTSFFSPNGSHAKGLEQWARTSRWFITTGHILPVKKLGNFVVFQWLHGEKLPKPYSKKHFVCFQCQ